MSILTYDNSLCKVEMAENFLNLITNIIKTSPTANVLLSEIGNSPGPTLTGTKPCGLHQDGKPGVARSEGPITHGQCPWE